MGPPPLLWLALSLSLASLEETKKNILGGKGGRGPPTLATIVHSITENRCRQRWTRRRLGSHSLLKTGCKMSTQCPTGSHPRLSSSYMLHRGLEGEPLSVPRITTRDVPALVDRLPHKVRSRALKKRDDGPRRGRSRLVFLRVEGEQFQQGEMMETMPPRTSSSTTTEVVVVVRGIVALT